MYEHTHSHTHTYMHTSVGNLAIDIVAHTLDDMSQAKIDEELKYYQATQGRSLNDDDAAKKVKVTNIHAHKHTHPHTHIITHTHIR